ncbi:MAG: ATP-binding cassette domain-containing protein, partial [Kiritimatiellae bacterium]|nr:ATP-binding cassette domain-containing protein [Kiritimatiellia bacterium]
EGGRKRLDMVLMERLQLVERLPHRPDALSGGERQRVAIARALSMNPEVILADEPTGNLDSITARGVCALLRELNRTEQRTILMVTHDPLTAAWADRVLLLRDGCLVDEFTVEGEEDAARISEHYFRRMTESVVRREASAC